MTPHTTRLARRFVVMSVPFSDDIDGACWFVFDMESRTSLGVASYDAAKVACARLNAQVG